MDEQARVEKINFNVAGHLQEWIEQIESGEATADDLLSVLYGSLIAAIILGYDPDALVNDAKIGAQKLNELVAEELNDKQEGVEQALEMNENMLKSGTIDKGKN